MTTERITETVEQPKTERLTYTVQEAADAAGVSKSIIYDAIRSGSLEHRKIGRGGKIIIPRDAVAQWVRGTDAN